MAKIDITSDLLRKTADEMEGWLRDLRETADCMEQWQPNGFVLLKAPSVSNHITALIDFTSQVRVEAESARVEKRWGKRAKSKRREKSSDQ